MKKNEGRGYDAEFVHPQYRKRKRHISPMFLWVLVFAAAAVFFAVFWAMPMFPRKWSWYLLAVLTAVVVLSGILSAAAGNKNWFVKGLDLILALSLSFGSAILPYYTEKVSDLFNSVVGDQVKINLYVLSDMPDKELTEYRNDVFITTETVDQNNQKYALSQLTNMFTETDILPCGTAAEAAAALYDRRGDVLILSEAYESVLADTEGFENFSEETKIIYSFYRTIESPFGNKKKVKMTSEPFTVFFGGNDQEGELSLVGRTDVNMSVTVNPVSHQILIVSMPRDSYIPNPALGDMKDKLTHLGVQDIKNTLDGFGNCIGIDIENYVLVNFTTFRNIIDAVDGVDVDNPYAFTYTWDTDYHYDQGMIHLDGDSALYYVRERYNLPDGDFGRNMHQQLVMKALISKLMSPEVIVHFNDILGALDGTFLTNISGDSVYAFFKMQLEDNAEWNIVNYQVKGLTGMEECASAPGQSLSVVYPDEEQMAFIRQEVLKVISGEEIEQQEFGW